MSADRPTHVPTADLLEIVRLDMLERLAREQAATALARAEAIASQRSLYMIKVFASLSVPFAATVDNQTGAITYPPEPSAAVKAALDAERANGAPATSPAS